MTRNKHRSRTALLFAIPCLAIIVLAGVLVGAFQQSHDVVTAQAFWERSYVESSGCGVPPGYYPPRFQDWSCIQNGFGWILDGQDNVLLKSDDGGSSWVRLPLPQKDIISICFVNNLKGWVLGSDALVWSSSDGGQSWKPGDSPAFPDGKNSLPRKIQFFNEQQGIVVGAGRVLYSTDGGKSWNVSELDEGEWELFSVFVCSPDSVWLPESEGALFHSTDAGMTWTSVEVERSDNLGFTSLFFLDNRAWATSANLSSVVFHSDNGGKNWSRLRTRWEMPRARYDRHESIWFQSPDIGFIVGGVYDKEIITEPQGYVLKTQDGGKTWRPVNISDAFGPYSAVVFHDNDRGWVLSRSFILYTKDGGESWERATIVQGAIAGDGDA